LITRYYISKTVYTGRLSVQALYKTVRLQGRFTTVHSSEGAIKYSALSLNRGVHTSHHVHGTVLCI